MNILKTLRKPYNAMFLAFLFLFVSCDNNDEISNTELNIQSKFESKLINDSSLSKNLSGVFKSKFAGKSNNNTFNFEKISEVKDTETGDFCYMVDSNNENLKLGVYPKDNGEYSLLTLELITTGDFKNILYKNTQGELVTKVSMNTKTGKLSVSTENSSKYSAKTSGCGEKVANCLTDAYSNHGWKSVASWVITAFQPAFGVGMAIGCAVKDC